MDAVEFVEARHRMHPRVNAWLRRHHSHDEAADLTDEVFAQAWASRDGYDPAKASADTWLYGIAANTSARTRRRHAIARRHTPIPTPDIADDSDFEDRIIETVVAGHLVALVLAALADLNAPDLDLINTIIAASLAGFSVAPFTNAQHIRLHRLRHRLARKASHNKAIDPAASPPRPTAETKVEPVTLRPTGPARSQQSSSAETTQHQPNRSVRSKPSPPA